MFHSELAHTFTLSGLTLHCRLHPPQAANCCRNSRLVVNKDDLKWVVKGKKIVIIKTVQRNFRSETNMFQEIRSFFGYTKWCFNASSGLKVLKTHFVSDKSDLIG